MLEEAKDIKEGHGMMKLIVASVGLGVAEAMVAVDG